MTLNSLDVVLNLAAIQYYMHCLLCSTIGLPFNLPLRKIRLIHCFRKKPLLLSYIQHRAHNKRHALGKHIPQQVGTFAYYSIALLLLSKWDNELL